MMKKSLLALLIGSALILSGCKDEQVAKKLLEAEKKIVQLEAKLQQAQKDLTAKTNELTELQSAVAIEKATQKNAFPALKTKKVELFNQSKEIKHVKDPNDEFYREVTPISVTANMLETGIEWLDNQLLLGYLTKEKRAGLETSAEIKKAVLKSLNQEYQEQEKMAKESKDIELESSYNTYYVGQREHIATFQQFFYQYMGGAHGAHQTHYLNFDANKQSLIQLNDLVDSKYHDKLKAMLWEAYLEKSLEETGDSTDTYMPKSDFFISENFYFTPNGIQFVYPHYSLAPYAAGETELFLNFYQLENIANSDYLPK